ncbi:MAG: metal ABC transporter permease [Bacillota bacterium]|nr:metal ABC transporter permease [Bacillota bacterium]
MEIWNQIVSILPFDWAQPGQMMFMKIALLAVILISPVFGLLGTMVVNNKMAFFSDALGHSAFAGIAIGALLGLVSPLWAAVIFSLLFALGITFVKHRSRMHTDTVIGVFSSTAIALGIAISTIGGKSFAKFTKYLIGDILSITPGEIGIIAIVLVCVIILWVFVFNKLAVISVDASLAGSKGIKVFWVEAVFTAAVAMVVTLSISWIGLLVINSFVVLPAAAARNISKNMRQYHLYSVLFALFSGIAGLIGSYYVEIASGAAIVLVSALIFFITFFFRNRGK